MAATDATAGTIAIVVLIERIGNAADVGTHSDGGNIRLRRGPAIHRPESLQSPGHPNWWEIQSIRRDPLTVAEDRRRPGVAAWVDGDDHDHGLLDSGPEQYLGMDVAAAGAVAKTDDDNVDRRGSHPHHRDGAAAAGVMNGGGCHLLLLEWHQSHPAGLVLDRTGWGVPAGAVVAVVAHHRFLPVPNCEWLVPTTFPGAAVAGEGLRPDFAGGAPTANGASARARATVLWLVASRAAAARDDDDLRWNCSCALRPHPN